MYIVVIQAGEYEVDLTVKPPTIDDKQAAESMNIDSNNNVIDSFDNIEIYLPSLDLNSFANANSLTTQSLDQRLPHLDPQYIALDLIKDSDSNAMLQRPSSYLTYPTSDQLMKYVRRQPTLLNPIVPDFVKLPTSIARPNKIQSDEEVDAHDPRWLPKTLQCRVRAGINRMGLMLYPVYAKYFSLTEKFKIQQLFDKYYRSVPSSCKKGKSM